MASADHCNVFYCVFDGQRVLCLIVLCQEVKSLEFAQVLVCLGIGQREIFGKGSDDTHQIFDDI